jgi:glycosyltransferase involved in cell wall biosynthesis
MNSPPIISVIIPTHNRSEILSKNLLALDCQTLPTEQFEVLVIADACQDNTLERVTSLVEQVSYRLRLFCHAAYSASATRNLGALHAEGKILLFLDDDVIAGPGLIAAHLEASRDGRVVLGYSRPVLSKKPSFWQYQARLWWEDSFRAMASPDHRFSYRDFFSGNVSMATQLFRSLNGFDETIKVRLEDYELGVRLLKSGARFHFSPRAIGYHYDETDQAIWLKRVYKEGIADVQICQRHPELGSLIFAGLVGSSLNWGRLRNAIRSVSIRKSRLVDAFAGLGQFLARILERVRFRGPWIHLNGALRDYYYWRGVADTIGGWRELNAWFQEMTLTTTAGLNAPVIDLTDFPSGEELEQCLESAAIAGLRVLISGLDLLLIPPQPDKEPLREEHIWGAIRKQMEQQIPPAIAFHLTRSAGGKGLPCRLGFSN